MPSIIKAVEELDWLLPTPIQQDAIPMILGGGDVLAVRIFFIVSLFPCSIPIFSSSYSLLFLSIFLPSPFNDFLVICVGAIFFPSISLKKAFLSPMHISFIHITPFLFIKSIPSLNLEILRTPHTPIGRRDRVREDWCLFYSYDSSHT